MKKILIFTLLFFSLSAVFAQIPAGYYDSAEGKTGYTLKTALYNIIKNPSVDSYNGLWSDFYKTDVDKYYENDGTVLDIYSENPTSSDPYEFTLGDDQCGNYSGEGSCYNREHSFPKSWFNDASPMYSDLFHIYPTDGYVNNKRSNYPYGETDNPSWTSMNGCKLGPSSISGYSGTVFEPIDEFKGDLARTYFYMATCYEDRIDTWSSDVLDGSTDKVYVDWFLNMLIQWHEQDPVSQKEIDRNDSIYKIQGNRNPFIDHPEWVECIWLNQCSGTVAPPENFVATAVSSSQIDLSWNLNTDNDSVVLAYNTTNTFGTPTGNYNAGDNISGGGTVLYVGTNTSFSHTGLSSQTYYYKIWSVDSSEYSTGVETSASPLLPEPTNHVTNFTVSSTTSSSITLTWTDASGGTEPTAYLIKAALSGNSITPPSDGTPETDDLYTKNIAQGIQTVTFDNLQASTSYDFEIFPYTNSGTNIDYKTDGTIPTATGTTDDTPPASDTCGNETFDNLATGSSSYGDRSWTGQDGSTWTATDARTDQSITSGNPAICIRSGYIQSGTISGGISSLSVTTLRVFSGGSGDLTVYINGTQVGTIPYSDVVQTSTIENIDVSGDIVLKIESNNSDRIVVDDIVWTCYSCSPQPTPPDAVSANPTEICSGDAVTLSYTGGNGDVFNWYSISCGDGFVGNGNNLTVNPNTTTTYYGRWENSCGESPCLSVTITVNPETAIIQQPENQNICEGSDANFSVTATGTNLQYQWQKDGSDISGETSSTLTITNVSTDDEGNYSCIVTGDCGQVSSDIATLSILSQPVITEDPVGSDVCEGGNVDFSVTASGDNIQYQWQKDNADISGATQNTLSLTNVGVGDAGAYHCVVSNTCGEATSNDAILNVYETTAITQQPESQNACENENVSFSVTANGYNLQYQWQKDGIALSGETLSTLTITNVSTDDEGNYSCVVTGDCGQVTSDTANLHVIQDITISDQPNSITANEGDTAMFTVTANGENITYQWYKNEISIPQANNDTLYIYNVSVADAGNYYCVLDNSCQNISTDTVTLTVEPNAISNSKTDNIVIYPNPNNGNFAVYAPYNHYKIMIYDINGKNLYYKICNSKKYILDLKNFPDGFYFIKIETENETVFKKLIIEK